MAERVVKFAGRNINNLRYADDTPLLAETEEDLKQLVLMSHQECSTTQEQVVRNTQQIGTWKDSDEGPENSVQMPTCKNDKKNEQSV